MISIVLTVHNQEAIIQKVLNGIWRNSSPLVKEIIIVLDGCTDQSEGLVMEYLLNHPGPATRILYADDVYETKANNIGLKMAGEPYVMIIQDDIVIEEMSYDTRLMVPMYGEVFAVSGRDAHDNIITNGLLYHINQAGADFNTPRDIFAIRDSCNRGPLLLRNDVLESLGYLDETYAPLFLDDHDLCHRAYREGGWLAGAYWVKFRSDRAWGGTRKGKVAFFDEAWNKNAQIFIERHREALEGAKHTEDRRI